MGVERSVVKAVTKAVSRGGVPDLVKRAEARLGRSLTKKEVAQLDKKALQTLAKKTTTAGEAAKLLGKEKLTAKEATGFADVKRTPTPKQKKNSAGTALAKRGEMLPAKRGETLPAKRGATPAKRGETLPAKRGEQRVSHRVEDADYKEIPSRRKLGKRLAGGAAATGLIYASQRGDDRVEDMGTETKAPTPVTRSMDRQSARHGVAPASVPSEAAQATAAQAAEAGVPTERSQEEVDRSGSYVDTKGGRYHIYKKGSQTANSWREAYAAAREAGDNVFTFNGLKYKV